MWVSKRTKRGMNYILCSGGIRFFFFFFVGALRGQNAFLREQNPKICQNDWFLHFFFYRGGGKWGGQSLRGSDWGANAPSCTPSCRHWSFVDKLKPSFVYYLKKAMQKLWFEKMMLKLRLQEAMQKLWWCSWMWKYLSCKISIKRGFR